MKQDSRSRGEQEGKKALIRGNELAWVGGGIAAAVALVGQLLVGYVYNGSEAHDLLQALIPSAQSLGGAVVQASATILALMLTLLGMSRREIEDLETGFFNQIALISALSSIALASAILLLLFLSIPLQQSKTLRVNWFQGIYYVLVVIIGAIAGLVIAIVIMLYSAIQSIIRAVRHVPAGEIGELRDGKRPG